MSFEEKLQKIYCLEELYGFANRRKVTGCFDDNIFPPWSEEERRIISEKVRAEKDMHRQKNNLKRGCIMLS